MVQDVMLWFSNLPKYWNIEFGVDNVMILPDTESPITTKKNSDKDTTLPDNLFGFAKKISQSLR